MSGIPSDIENAAMTAMRNMDLGDAAYGYSGLRIRKAVAAAILAERRRCADVARTAVDDFYDSPAMRTAAAVIANRIEAAQ